jgi:hypothetical protein
MRGLRSKLTFANVCSFLALLIAIGTGSAYAANTIFSTDIVNGEVKTLDLATNAVTTGKIANGQVQTADIGANQVLGSHVLNDNLTGVDIAANSLKGADIDESTLDIGDAARAYARVLPSSCSGTPGGPCSVDRSKGVSSVTHETTGSYCITAPGIDSHHVAAAVTVDWSGTDPPEGNTSAMLSMGSVGGCLGDGGFRVITERQPTITVDRGGGVNNGTASGLATTDDDVGFTIVIP